MVATEKELEKKTLICNLCNTAIKAGESYEEITTKRKTKLIIHTECFKK